MPRGIWNEGQSCWLASCLQVLVSVPTFRRNLLRLDTTASLKHAERARYADVILRLQVALAQLSTPDKLPIFIDKLLRAGNALKKISDTEDGGFSPVRQEDAVEHFMYLLDFVEKINFNTALTPFLAQLTETPQGQGRRAVHCTPLQPQHNVLAAIRTSLEFTVEGEPLPRLNWFDHLPEVLVCNVGRTNFFKEKKNGKEEVVFFKNLDRFEVYPEIPMDRFLASNKTDVEEIYYYHEEGKNAKGEKTMIKKERAAAEVEALMADNPNLQLLQYRLHAVVMHTGPSVTSGHYFVLRRCSPDRFLVLDDERCEGEVDEEFVLAAASAAWKMPAQYQKPDRPPEEKPVLMTDPATARLHARARAQLRPDGYPETLFDHTSCGIMLIYIEAGREVDMGGDVNMPASLKTAIAEEASGHSSLPKEADRHDRTDSLIKEKHPQLLHLVDPPPFFPTTRAARQEERGEQQARHVDVRRKKDAEAREAAMAARRRQQHHSGSGSCSDDVMESDGAAAAAAAAAARAALDKRDTDTLFVAHQAQIQVEAERTMRRNARAAAREAAAAAATAAGTQLQPGSSSSRSRDDLTEHDEMMMAEMWQEDRLARMEIEQKKKRDKERAAREAAAAAIGATAVTSSVPSATVAAAAVPTVVTRSPPPRSPVDDDLEILEDASQSSSFSFPSAPLSPRGVSPAAADESSADNFEEWYEDVPVDDDDDDMEMEEIAPQARESVAPSTRREPAASPWGTPSAAAVEEFERPAQPWGPAAAAPAAATAAAHFLKPAAAAALAAAPLPKPATARAAAPRRRFRPRLKGAAAAARSLQKAEARVARIKDRLKPPAAAAAAAESEGSSHSRPTAPPIPRAFRAPFLERLPQPEARLVGRVPAIVEAEAAAHAAHVAAAAAAGALAQKQLPLTVDRLAAKMAAEVRIGERPVEVVDMMREVATMKEKRRREYAEGKQAEARREERRKEKGTEEATSRAAALAEEGARAIPPPLYSEEELGVETALLNDHAYLAMQQAAVRQDRRRREQHAAAYARFFDLTADTAFPSPHEPDWYNTRTARLDALVHYVYRPEAPCGERELQGAGLRAKTVHARQTRLYKDLLRGHAPAALLERQEQHTVEEGHAVVQAIIKSVLRSACSLEPRDWSTNALALTEWLDEGGVEPAMLIFAAIAALAAHSPTLRARMMPAAQRQDEALRPRLRYLLAREDVFRVASLQYAKLLGEQHLAPIEEWRARDGDAARSDPGAKYEEHCTRWTRPTTIMLNAVQGMTPKKRDVAWALHALHADAAPLGRMAALVYATTVAQLGPYARAFAAREAAVEKARANAAFAALSWYEQNKQGKAEAEAVLRGEPLPGPPDTPERTALKEAVGALLLLAALLKWWAAEVAREPAIEVPQALPLVHSAAEALGMARLPPPRLEAARAEWIEWTNAWRGRAHKLQGEWAWQGDKIATFSLSDKRELLAASMDGYEAEIAQVLAPELALQDKRDKKRKEEEEGRAKRQKDNAVKRKKLEVRFMEEQKK